MNAEGASASERDAAWYADHILADADRFADVLDSDSVEAEVAACPGWTVERLAEHLGQIHRWARFCVLHARPPGGDEAAALESFPASGQGAWLRSGARELCDALRQVDPEAPTWHPFTVPHVAAVWPRRQAHETAVHRWDAEHAVGRAATIDAELASDGIDEYVELAIPRLVVRTGLHLPAGSLHLHCTDVDGEWLVWTENGEYRMTRAHEKGDAALRGPAELLLLRLWGRVDDRADGLDPIGDEQVLAGWLSIAGM